MSRAYDRDKDEFYFVDNDFGDELIRNVANADGPTILDGRGIRTFGDKAYEGLVDLF